jgi:superfamily II DNA or RNA helicase
MTERLIDNQTTRLVEAINAVLPHAQAARFATGYLFVSGLQPIADGLRQLEHVKLLIGTTTNRDTIEQLALGYRRRELVEEKLRQQRHVNVDRAMGDTVLAIRQSISEMQPGEREAHTISVLAELIASGKLDVRVYTRGVLHAKAYIFDYRNPQPNSRGIGIIGSSNLTEPGLASNTELNVQVDDNADIITGEGLHRDLCEWFDQLWNEARPFSPELMTELNESWALSVARPYDVYLKMLFELVRGRLEGEEARLLLPEEIPLAAYQKVAVQQAIRMVNQYGGAFVADVVGVGKSFVGSAVARFFYESERRRPLIVCPRRLKEMWEGYNRRWHLNAEILPMSMLRESRTSGDGASSGAMDDDRFQDCRFVLIDESHHFRYSEPQRYHILSDYLLGGTDRKVLLLTATPYNKSPWDVYNQLKLFHPGEIASIPIEPRNLRRYFRRVEDGERRLPDLLVHLLVRRTRWQLLRWYGYDKKFFPWRELDTIEYCVDDVYRTEFGEPLYETIVRLLHRRRASLPSEETEEDAAEAVDQQDPGALTYARYGLWNYVGDERKTDPTYKKLIRAGKNLRGLIRTSLFKRLESSVKAFRESIDRQVRVHRNFLAALDNNIVAAGERAMDILEGEVDETDDALRAFLEQLQKAEEERGFGYDINAFRVEELRADVEHDLLTFEFIQSLVTEERIPPKGDEKLQEFLRRLPDLVAGGKLLVFTQYEDTAKYVFEHLPENIKADAALATGDTEHPERIVRRFAPNANPPGLRSGEKELRLIVSTDVLSEGLNLQDCSRVLNYDLHWNPVRLIQRFGRVDRIGSEYEVVYAYNFLPEKAAERELELHEKLASRIQEFNAILGMDAQVLDRKERVNPKALYAIYEERSGRHLGRFEVGEAEVFGVSLAEAEEFFRELREREPAEYERIRNLRDGIRTARRMGESKVLVLCRAGDFIRLYVRDLKDEPVDIDTTDALALLKCDPDEPVAELPGQLNSILTGVKLALINEVDELWRQRRTRPPLSRGQQHVRDELDKLRNARPDLDIDGQIARLMEAVTGTRQRRFQRACERLKRDKVAGEPLLRRVRQLYYDCALHIERAVREEEEVDERVPRILAVAALV